jgi:hypothetical protein
MALLWLRIICVSSAALPCADRPCSMSSRVSSREYVLPSRWLEAQDGPAVGARRLRGLRGAAHLVQLPPQRLRQVEAAVGLVVRQELALPAHGLAALQRQIDVGQDVPAVGRDGDALREGIGWRGSRRYGLCTHIAAAATLPDGLNTASLQQLAYRALRRASGHARVRHQQLGHRQATGSVSDGHQQPLGKLAMRRREFIGHHAILARMWHAFGANRPIRANQVARIPAFAPLETSLLQRTTPSSVLSPPR